MHRLLLVLSFLHFLESGIAQKSIQRPLICHDQNNFLSYYNDGEYIFTFNQGDFISFKRSDSTLSYDNVTKKITFITSTGFQNLKTDTTRIILKQRYIIISTKDTTIEIHSLNSNETELSKFHISGKLNNIYYGNLNFIAGDTYYSIEISATSKMWSWNLKANRKGQRFGILYNTYKNNKLTAIIIQDDILKYGMSIWTTYRSHNKISKLESAYTDTMTINGKKAIDKIALTNYYNYQYDKNGKLILNKMKGELVKCKNE